MKEKYEMIQKIVQDAAGEIGLTTPGTIVFASADRDILQLLKFAQSTCDELLTRYPWRRFIGHDPWVKAGNGAYKDAITEDGDTPLIDARLIKMGVRWRYLHSKGLTYNEDFRSYMLRMSSIAFAYNQARDINMNDEMVS